MKDQIQKAFEKAYDGTCFKNYIEKRQIYQAFVAGFQTERWIKIEEGCEMPKVCGKYRVVLFGEELHAYYNTYNGAWKDTNNVPLPSCITHYQPLILPEE